MPDHCCLIEIFVCEHQSTQGIYHCTSKTSLCGAAYESSRHTFIILIGGEIVRDINTGRLEPRPRDIQPYKHLSSPHSILNCIQIKLSPSCKMIIL